MKSILLTSLLLLSPSSPFMQIVIYNTTNEMIYILEVDDPFTLIPIPHQTYLPITCLNNEVKRLQDVDFTHAPFCLIDSLNQSFDFQIQEYINLNYFTSPTDLKQLIENKKLNEFIQFYHQTKTSFTLIDLYQNYQKYKEVPLTYTLQYPFLIQLSQGYLPLSFTK